MTGVVDLSLRAQTTGRYFSCSKRAVIETNWKVLCGELILEARNTNVQYQLSIALKTS